MADLMYCDPNVTLKRQVDVRYGNRMIHVFTISGMSVLEFLMKIVIMALLQNDSNVCKGEIFTEICASLYIYRILHIYSGGQVWTVLAVRVQQGIHW